MIRDIFVSMRNCAKHAGACVKDWTRKRAWYVLLACLMVALIRYQRLGRSLYKAKYRMDIGCLSRVTFNARRLRTLGRDSMQLSGCDGHQRGKIMLRILLLVLCLFAAPVFAAANCPDADGDGYVESCLDDDGVFVPSEDNCIGIYNPAQQYLRLVMGSWVEDSGNCYDINGDGGLTYADYAAVSSKLLANTQGTFFNETSGMVGDLNGNPYTLSGHVIYVDFDDFTLVTCGLIRLGAIPYTINPACLIQ